MPAKTINPEEATGVIPLLKLMTGEDVTIHTLDGASHPGKVKLVASGNVFLTPRGGAGVHRFIPGDKIVCVDGVVLN